MRLTLFDLGATALAGVAVTVAGTALTTDGSGLVEATIDNGARDVRAQTPTDQLDRDIRTLNPSDDQTDAGWKARLYNLGFLWDPTADEGDDEMTVALQDLQAQYRVNPERSARRRNEGEASASLRGLNMADDHFTSGGG